MSRGTIELDSLTAIANAIRGKLGVQDTYTPGQMSGAIQSIPTGITPTGTVNIAQNGTHDVTQYASANVNVQPTLQSKTATQNGTVTADSGYDGLSSVVVDVSGGGSTTPAIALNIRSQAYISGNSTIMWSNSSYPKYKQFWLDLQPYQGRQLTITNSGDRNFYGFTTVEPYDNLNLNAGRIDSGGRLTVTYNGGPDRYLVYDFSTVIDGGLLTISVN